MAEARLLGLLGSGNYEQMKQALIYIQKKLQQEPTPLLAQKLLELCLDNDPDIRNEAIQAAGFYWYMPEALPILTEILARPDEDEIVLNAAVYAVDALAVNVADLRPRGLSLLAQVALSDCPIRGGGCVK